MTDIKNYFNQLVHAIYTLPENVIQDNIDTLKKAYVDGKQIFILGNGGSASTASHIACDLQKGLKMHSGRKFKVISLTDNMAIVTAWANDASYDDIFTEQIDSLLNPGDVIIAISSSGNSRNVIKAVELANEMGGITIGWSGFNGGRLNEVVQKSLVVECDNVQRIEDIHMMLGHVVFSCILEQVDTGYPTRAVWNASRTSLKTRRSGSKHPSAAI